MGRKGPPPSGGKMSVTLWIVAHRNHPVLTSALILATQPVSRATSCVCWKGLEGWQRIQSTHSVDPPIIIQTVPVLTQHRNRTNECRSTQLLVARFAPSTSKGAKDSEGSGSCTPLGHPLVKMSSISSSRDRDHLQTVNTHTDTKTSLVFCKP